jgi:hypothetical protein
MICWGWGILYKKPQYYDKLMIVGGLLAFFHLLLGAINNLFYRSQEF